VIVAISWSFEYHANNGRRYLYAVEKKRTPKGPHNTRYGYLGTAESLLKRLATPGKPLKSFEFGKMSALIHAARETGLLGAFQRHAPRGSFDGYSVENVLFLQMAARVERPMSREDMAKWLRESLLPLILPATGHPSSRTLRRYLKRLYGAGEGEKRGEGLLSRSVIHRIETQVFQTLLKKGIDPRWMLFDTTNFLPITRGAVSCDGPTPSKNATTSSMRGWGWSPWETSRSFPRCIPPTRGMSKSLPGSSMRW
jgi:hypothetical protein